jgi:FMN phosphatase YigB (HAD superfamily)
MGEPAFVFFDIGDTLASARLGADGRLAGLDVYPFVTDVLTRLRARTGQVAGLGLISNTGGETAASMRRVLDDCGLSPCLDDELWLFSSVEGLDKSKREFFELAAGRAGAAPTRCVFVGESEAERRVATSAGFSASPHPLHVFHLLDQQFSHD